MKTSGKNRQIVTAMVRIGVLGFGGGPSTVPLFRYEAVHRYKWLEDSEFVEVLALANALPGPIATKLAAYLGHRLSGGRGGMLAVAAHIMPACCATIVLYGAFAAMQQSAVVSGMISAVLPVISVMLGQMAYQFARNAVKGLGLVFGLAAGLLAFALLGAADVSPAVVVLLFLAYGAAHYKLRDKLGKRRTGSANSDGGEE